MIKLQEATYLLKAETVINNKKYNIILDKVLCVLQRSFLHKNLCLVQIPVKKKR